MGWPSAARPPAAATAPAPPRRRKAAVFRAATDRPIWLRPPVRASPTDRRDRAACTDATEPVVLRGTRAHGFEVFGTAIPPDKPQVLAETEAEACRVRAFPSRRVGDGQRVHRHTLSRTATRPGRQALYLAIVEEQAKVQADPELLFEFAGARQLLVDQHADHFTVAIELQLPCRRRRLAAIRPGVGGENVDRQPLLIHRDAVVDANRRRLGDVLKGTADLQRQHVIEVPKS